MLQAMMLADHVYMDASTGKKVIAGAFHRLSADSFPCNFDETKVAFLSLTGLHGSADLTLRYVDLSTGEALMEIQDVHVESDDPLQTIELVVELPKLPMPHPGAYAFEAHWEGELLGVVRLFVAPAEHADEPASGDA